MAASRSGAGMGGASDAVPETPRNSGFPVRAAGVPRAVEDDFTESRGGRELPF